MTSDHCRRRKMYSSDDHQCLPVVSVPRRMPTLLHGAGCNLGDGRGCPLVVHYWADLPLVMGFFAMTT